MPLIVEMSFTWLGVKRCLLALFIGMASVASTACLGGPASQTQSAKPVLRIGLPLPPTSLDPAKDSNAGLFKDISYTSIIHINPDGTFGPALATSWKYLDSPKGPNREFEFTLRSDAKFSNGEPVTAQAAAGWLTYFAGAHGYFAIQMGPDPVFEATSSDTVQIHLQVPHPNIPRLLAEVDNWGWVAAPQAVANPDLFALNTYGAGPYMLDGSRSVSNDHYTFVPNPYYFDPAGIKFSEVDVKIIGVPSTLLQAMQADQIDVAIGDASTAASASAAGLTINSAPVATQSLFIADWNGSLVKPFGDQRVRQAMNYAVDRKAIVDGLLGQYGHVTSEVASVDSMDPQYTSYYTYDPDKARSLLGAAGYPDGFSFSIVDTGAGQALGDNLWQAVAKYFDAVGIHMEIKVDPPQDWQSDILSKNYAAFPYSSGIQPVFIIWPPISPGGGLNPFNNSDPQMNQFYSAGLASSAPSDQWKPMYGRMTEQGYFIPLLTYDYLYYIDKKVDGVVVSDKRVAFAFPQEWSPK
jgi:peptide/nickel transport system substrate-binding protein